jgi:hypothetical protein
LEHLLNEHWKRKRDWLVRDKRMIMRMTPMNRADEENVGEIKWHLERYDIFYTMEAIKGSCFSDKPIGGNWGEKYA